MKKFSKISGEKIGEPKPVEKKAKDLTIDTLKGGVMQLMDNYLSVQMYGPITRYHVAGTMKVAGKELFLEALMDMLEEVTNKSKVKMLEGMKIESNDWQLIDNKIDELNLTTERVSNSKLVNHKEKIKSIYNRYKPNKEDILAQFDRLISHITSGENAYLRGIAAETLISDPKFSTNIMKEIADKYFFKAKQLGFTK